MQRGLQVEYSGIRTYITPTTPSCSPLVVCRDVASYVSTRGSEGIRMHDVIVRLLRVQSKGCSSQRSEFCCGNSTTWVGVCFCSLFQNLCFAITSTAASKFPPLRCRGRACARQFRRPG